VSSRRWQQPPDAPEPGEAHAPPEEARPVFGEVPGEAPTADLGGHAARAPDEEPVRAPDDRPAAEEPAAPPQEPAAPPQEPAAAPQEPAPAAQEPAAGAQEPAAGAQETAAGAQETAAGAQEPPAEEAPPPAEPPAPEPAREEPVLGQRESVVADEEKGDMPASDQSPQAVPLTGRPDDEAVSGDGYGPRPEAHPGQSDGGQAAWERPEVLLGAAFACGLVLAVLLRRRRS
jgi:hypothetical protein